MTVNKNYVVLVPFSTTEIFEGTREQISEKIINQLISVARQVDPARIFTHCETLYVGETYEEITDEDDVFIPVEAIEFVETMIASGMIELED